MKVIVDKINDGKITVELEDKSFAVMDLKIMPDAKEGDVLTIEIDSSETEKRKNNIKTLMNNLFED